MENPFEWRQYQFDSAMVFAIFFNYRDLVEMSERGLSLDHTIIPLLEIAPALNPTHALIFGWRRGGDTGRSQRGTA